MRKMIASALIFGLALSLTGCMRMFSKGNAKAEVNTYEFEDKIDSVVIETTSFDVRIKKAAGNKTVVILREADLLRHDVECKDGVLRIAKRKTEGAVNAVNIPLEIEVQLPKDKYPHIDINTGSGDIAVDADFTFDDAVYVASSGDVFSEVDVTGTLRSETGSGDQHISNVYGRSVEASSSSGDVTVSAVYGTDVSVKTSSGKAELRDVVIKGKLNVNTSSGDVILSRCDAAAITVRTTSGDVTGELLSGKEFSASTGSGSVRIPESTSGGICEIKTGSGDIRITVR